MLDRSPQTYKKKQLTHHQIDDEVLLYDAATGATHRMNQTAFLIWRSCNGYRNSEAISLRLRRIWDVDAHRAERDVRTAIKQMVRQGLLERSR